VPSSIVQNSTPAEFAADPELDKVLPFHRKLPRYAPTPLVSAPRIAAKLGVERVWVKDESSRLGLPAYKILGASWATYRALEQRFGEFAPWETIEELARQLYPHRRTELVTASEGNHGRAVARMARWLGLSANILLPASAAKARVERIRDERARVTMIDGTYDDAVEAVARLDGQRSLVISDTAWPGYEQVPQWVVDGYSTLFRETEAQLAEAGEQQPDVVAVQMGVGSLAAAVVRHYRRPGSGGRVIRVELSAAACVRHYSRLGVGGRGIGVEPSAAACVLESMRAGRLVDVAGPFDEVMGGLNCGRPSLVAWPFLKDGLSACVPIPTSRAEEAVRSLAADGVASTACGAAGLAGLLEYGKDLGLSATATVLVVSTEGPEAAR
jgi:diaminopropionate ammonia-lyase